MTTLLEPHNKFETFWSVAPFGASLRLPIHEPHHVASHHLNFRNHRNAYARRYRGYLGSASDSAQVDRHIVQRAANCGSVWSAPS
jgi:hypothetical protein